MPDQADETWRWLSNGLKGIAGMFEMRHGDIPPGVLAQIDIHLQRIGKVIEREKEKATCSA